jgi:uncharacterized protein YkwD
MIAQQIQPFPPNCLEIFRDKALKMHNRFRSYHGVGALVEDNYLDFTAESYAKRLGKQPKFMLVNSPKNERTLNYGENLAAFFDNESIFDNCEGNILFLFLNHLFCYIYIGLTIE